MVEREAEALRDGEQAAREREQAQAEMEQTLVAQEQALERGTGSPIAEQADTGDPGPGRDGENVIIAGEGSGSAHQGMGADASGVGIASPGAGTDELEQSASTGPLDDVPRDPGPEFAGGERTFEGEGRRPLEEQGESRHAIERPAD